ncbi:hypothetical protein WN944_024386 [Citrus x changshan-huyou]|uniref:Uncharacterized protein n=1 Tax=Citrus x changshan-huyou TaxID=2935761 RepID=A0AAP0QC08_9ROSI
MARTISDDFNKVSIANIRLRTLQCSFTLSVRNLHRKLNPVLETEPKIPVPTRLFLLNPSAARKKYEVRKSSLLLVVT